MDRLRLVVNCRRASHARGSACKCVRRVGRGFKVEKKLCNALDLYTHFGYDLRRRYGSRKQACIVKLRLLICKKVWSGVEPSSIYKMRRYHSKYAWE